MTEYNESKHVENRKQISELKMEPAQTNKNKTQSNQISSVEITSFFSKVLSDTVESTQLMFAEQSKELNKLKEKLADENKPPNNGKINSNNTDILNVFWKSLQELREFNETEFENFNSRLFMQNTQIQTQAIEIQNLSLQLEKEKKIHGTLTEQYEKLHQAFYLLKEQISERSIFDEKLTETSTIDNEDLLSRLCFHHNKSTSISTGTISLMASSESDQAHMNWVISEKIPETEKTLSKAMKRKIRRKEKKLQEEILTTSQKNALDSLNNHNKVLPSSQSISTDTYPLVSGFYPGTSTFPTAPVTLYTFDEKLIETSTIDNEDLLSRLCFHHNKSTSISTGTISLMAVSESDNPEKEKTLSKTMKRKIKRNKKKLKKLKKLQKEILATSQKNNLDSSSIFPTVPGILYPVLGTFATEKSPNALSKVQSTLSKSPEILSASLSKLLPSSNTLSATPDGISSQDISLSRSCSETSLGSNDSNNDQFLSYLDKAQLYLKQMTSGIMNNPLNEGDSKQEGLLLYEEGSESEEEKK